jgi:hypothetical protein
VPVTTASAPINNASPAIIGTLKAGQTLTCSPRSWSGSADSYSYQWSRDGTPVAGATNATYTVQQLDEGDTLTCTVTAADVAGAGKPATTAGLAIPVPYVHRAQPRPAASTATR